MSFNEKSTMSEWQKKVQTLISLPLRLCDGFYDCAVHVSKKENSNKRGDRMKKKAIRGENDSAAMFIGDFVY